MDRVSSDVSHLWHKIVRIKHFKDCKTNTGKVSEMNGLLLLNCIQHLWD